MIRQKIQDLIFRNPNIQYPLYWLYGAIKQIKYLFTTRKIEYAGEQPFLFIVGAGRSGNTLLRKLLMEHGDIYIPPESYILGQEVISHLSACALNWNDKVDLTLAKVEFHPEFPTFSIDTLRDFAIYAKGFTNEKQQIGTLIVELYQWIGKRNGFSTAWVGDKTPLNTKHLGLMRKLIPDAAYVYIERDGVDVCHSYMQAGIYNNISDAAHRWKNSRFAWKAFKKSIPYKYYVEIKYEYLVENYEQTIKSILDSLEIPLNNKTASILDKMGDVTMRAHHVNALTSPNKDSIGKGRRLLSDYEKTILKPIIGDELESAGYKAV